jgi:hypothetical protein
VTTALEIAESSNTAEAIDAAEPGDTAEAIDAAETSELDKNAPVE